MAFDTAPATANMTVILYPNFGSEEGLSWKAAARVPFFGRAAAAWRGIFNGDARFLDATASAPSQAAEGFATPAFDWLEEAAGLVPWLVTASAKRDAERLGLDVWGADPAVVRRVHDKAFALESARELGWEPPSLAGCFAVFEADAFLDPDHIVARIRAELARWPEPLRQRFTLKPRLGSSGRGRIPGYGDTPDTAELRGACRRLAARGGAILEPWLPRGIDLSAQYFIHPDGAIEPLGTLTSWMTTSGSYLGHRAVVGPDGSIAAGTAWDDEVESAGEAMARRAAQAGYWGPCGVDAFTVVTGRSGASWLRPVVEFNARFTLGTVALGWFRRLGIRGQRADQAFEGRHVALVFGRDRSPLPRPAGPGVAIWPLEAACGVAVLVSDQAEALDGVLAAAVTDTPAR